MEQGPNRLKMKRSRFAITATDSAIAKQHLLFLIIYIYFFEEVFFISLS
jgi:hypothetical protein